MSWLNFTTHEELDQYLADCPDNDLRHDDVIYAHLQIDWIERRKHIKVNTGCIDRFLKHKKNLRKFDEIITNWRQVMNYKKYTKHLKYRESAMAPW